MNSNVVPPTTMIQCPHCDEPIAEDAEQCPTCRRWFADRIIAKTTHVDANVREAAVNNLVFVDRTEKTVAALADALNDPVQAVRRAAGAMLFTSGAAAKHVIPTLIAALDDHDYYIRRTAAAALSNVGSHGRSAISRLTELKDTDDGLLRAWVVEALKRIGDGGPQDAA